MCRKSAHFVGTFLWNSGSMNIPQLVGEKPTTSVNYKYTSIIVNNSNIHIPSSCLSPHSNNAMMSASEFTFLRLSPPRNGSFSTHFEWQPRTKNHKCTEGIGKEIS